MLAMEPVLAPESVSPRWSTATRFAFRFGFLYFTAYVLLTQMLGSLLPVPGVEIPSLGELAPFRQAVQWAARHVFGVAQPLVVTGSGSGDKTFDWVQVFCLIGVAAAGTGIWSAVDRRRANYVVLHKWFRLFLRFALGATMATYGMIKLVPIQMPAPGLARLLEPFGHFSPMGVLWFSVGASRPYEMVIGAMELTAGTLLFIPRLALVGALVCLVDTVTIFTLNMTYDVPVKLFAFHLIVMSLVLIAPHARRLVDVAVLDRTPPPSSIPPLVRGRVAARVLLAAQLLFGACILSVDLYGNLQAWKTFGGGAPKSPLYGIWTVERMWTDGVERAPLVTDHGRWRRILFQTPAAMSFERMDDTFAGYAAVVDTGARPVTLTKPSDKSWRASFKYVEPAPDGLVLDGEMDGHRLRLETRLLDQSGFLVVSRGFHWVQEYPFNR